MKPEAFSRRQALACAGLTLGAFGAGLPLASAANTAALSAGTPAPPFRFCLNTGTIRGQKLGIVKEAEVAAQAGFQAIEPWVEAIDQYVRQGGSLPELRRRIGDLGLTVESAIAFSEWVVDDDNRRAKGLERAKKDMDLVARIGGKRLAAPPAGATDVAGMDLRKAAERYRALLELGDQMDIVPQLEIWGFSKTLSRLSEALMVAAETGHPQACILADVFHLYKGGSAFKGLRLIHGSALPVFHMNDYPGDPPREQVNDGLRLFPGDGIAPIVPILGDLKAVGGGQVLSLELFNRKYWEQDALTVAREGLSKLKDVVARVS